MMEKINKQFLNSDRDQNNYRSLLSFVVVLSIYIASGCATTNIHSGIPYYHPESEAGFFTMLSREDKGVSESTPISKSKAPESKVVVTEIRQIPEKEKPVDKPVDKPVEKSNVYTVVNVKQRSMEPKKEDKSEAEFFNSLISPEETEKKSNNSSDTKQIVNVSKNGEYFQVGTASWYGRDFDGKKTASGEIFNSRKLTAAHKKLPLGTIIRVRNMENDKELVLRVNDRGPFVGKRILDVSEYASERLDFKEQGLTTIGIKVIRQGKIKARNPGVTKSYYQNYYPGLKDDVVRKDVKKQDVKKRIFRDEDSLANYSVQVGVFEDMKNAEILEKALSVFSAPVYILKRGSLFIVKAGKFIDRNGASELQDRLNADGFTTFISSP